MWHYPLETMPKHSERDTRIPCSELGTSERETDFTRFPALQFASEAGSLRC